jgi:hypothetical protein
MANAARIHAGERGKDPRRYADVRLRRRGAGARLFGVAAILRQPGGHLAARGRRRIDDRLAHGAAGVRFRPQPIPAGPLGAALVSTIMTAFETVYRRLYGRVADAVPVEAVNWRVAVRGPQPSVDLRTRAGTLTSDARAALKGSRPVYFPQLGEYRLTPVYDRYQMGPGSSFGGPAIVEERESTFVIGPGATASIDAYLNLVMRDDHAR